MTYLPLSFLEESYMMKCVSEFGNECKKAKEKSVMVNFKLAG